MLLHVVGPAARFARRTWAQNCQLSSVAVVVFHAPSITPLPFPTWQGAAHPVRWFVAALSSPGRVIRPQDIEFLHAAEAPAESNRERLPSLADAERAHIARVLDSVNWNKKQAAAVLEISRGTLYRKIVEYGLEETPPASRNRTTRPNQ